MKNKVVLIILIALLGATAYFFAVSNDELDDEESNLPTGQTGYTYISVQRKDLSLSVIATGIIKPKVGAEVKVGAQVSGIVKDLYVEVGSKVKKNQLLVVIEPDVYEAKVNQTLALKEQAEVEKKFAEIEFNRSKILHEKKIIADNELESASQRFEIAAAKLKQAEADYGYTILQLSYTQITSPIDGVIASVSTQKGETVAASFSSPIFFTIIDLNRLELWAYVDETDIGRISIVQRVSFTVDTYPGDYFEGMVETIYPKADIQNNVVNYITVIKIIQPDEIRHSAEIENKNQKTLRPEMTATVEIFTSLKKDVLVLPKKAVHNEAGKFYVNIMKNGRVEKRNITVGISDKKYYETISGLSEKEKVILYNLELE